MARVGVFVCHCGENIAGRVQVERVAEFARGLPGTTVVFDYPYMCSAPGQKTVADAIRAHALDRVVVAACSPQLHEPTFRTAVADAGLNPFLFEMANIREQCSWVHRRTEEATAKACDLVGAAVERVKLARPLEQVQVPVTRRALVIGGGVAGIRTALDIARSGYPVTLVEREPSLGGNMARLSETFPTLDCSQCILTPLMVEVAHHPLIELLTYAEVEEVSGHVGSFRVRIRKKPRYVRAEECTACGDCADACPQAVPNEFDLGLSARKAVYIPFPQAVPSVFTLDPDSCVNAALDSDTGFRVLACVRCGERCQPRAIDFDMRPEWVEREVGTIVVATGYAQSAGASVREYGYGTHPDVLTSLELERLLSASGPTGGEVRRLSDGSTPRDVVFIQCVGSRDPCHGVPYCSSICCMYTAKHALLVKHRVPGVRVLVFYMDVRAGGKGYEEFVNRVMEEEGAVYVRGRVGQVVARNGRLSVLGVNTLSGRAVEVDADLVILASACVASEGRGVASVLRIPTDVHGFFQEAHPKLRPVETLSAGIYLAGAAQGPKDIPSAVAQASAAAGKAASLLAQERLLREPTTARVNPETCAGCFECEPLCAYQAIERREVRDRDGNPVRRVAWSNPAVCEGCGVCVVTCRGGNIDLAGSSSEQLFAQLAALAPEPATRGARG